ncbi:MAG: PAS domain S-box protein [Bacteroidales bacterium]
MPEYERLYLPTPSRSPIVRFGLCPLTIAAAIGITVWLRPTIGGALFFPPFTAAVVACAWFGGLWPGLLATGAAGVANAYWFAEPFGSWVVAGGDDRLRLAVFVTTAIVLTLVIESRNRAVHRDLEQRARWRVALSSIGDAVIVCDEQGRIQFMNAVSEELTGWRTHEAAGRFLEDVFRIINEDTRTIVEDPVAKVLREGSVVGLANHTLLIRRDGREISIDDSAAPVRDPSGRLLGVILVYRDVTARRANERELDEHSRRMRMQAELLDHAYDAVFVRDASPQILYWNPACADLYGWTEKEALGQNPHDLLRTRFPVSLAEVKRALGAEGHWAGELVHFTRDGREVTVDSRHVVVPAEGEEGPRVLEINRDITDRKRAEETLRRSEERLAALYGEAQEANRLKDEFLATLSHELRTPLNAIRGWAQLLLGGKLAPDAVRRAYETIDRSAQAQTQLITDILDVSRIITGKLRLERAPVDVGALVKDTLDGVRPAVEAKRLQVRYSGADGVRILADRERLQQVFWNLLSNAVKFSKAGGRVDVSVAKMASRLEVKVSDTGVGIRRDFLPHVFERFTQSDASASRHYGGLGLGLAISRHLVELHGGSIAAFSEGEGLGATFVVSLPIQSVVEAEESQATVTPRAAAAEHRVAPSLSGLKVLVVDDEEDAREMLSAVLVQQEAEVVSAASAAEAIMALQRERPAVIVSDVGMPGQDGYVFMRIVRALPAAEGGDTPAVALTAYARSEDRLRALAAGYQQHVAKPVTPAELSAVVAALARRAARGEGE